MSGKIADHAIVTSRLNLGIPQTVGHSRKVWSYLKADWDSLENELDKADWSFMTGQNASQAALHTTKLILEAAVKHIPQRMLHSKKCSHPWLTDDVAQVIAEKRAAEGTPAYEDAVKACSVAIMKGYTDYAARAKQALLSSRSGSKLWWNLSREQLSQKAKVQSIPALKSEEGVWVHAPTTKADLLARTFSSKNILPERVANEYTDLEGTAFQQKKLRTLQLGEAAKTMEALDEQSGTGPDLLPARILKHCAAQLAYPILQLAMLILDSGEWPECWKDHWIVPLFKRGAVYLSKNYRGVHLTAQLSKVIERLISLLLDPHVTRWNLIGKNQFAYSKKKGARDVLALLCLRWTMALDRGHKVLVYCSDVSGAFDKVSRSRLLLKLHAKGIHPKLIKLIGSWLEPRRATVVVGGEKSSPFRIQDMVFQGTVLGPRLWNLFFEDAAASIKEWMYEEIIFADDLNAYKIVPSSTTVDKAMESLGNVQKELHRWGAANQVTFDSGKESNHVLSRTEPHGEDFKLLGVVFDCKLDMQSAIGSLMGKVKWKIVMLFRSRRSFSTPDLVL